jgi:hypothetical protein
LRDDLPARIAEIALAVKLTDLPWLFDAHAIDRADEISIRHRMCRLLKLPQVLGESGDGG